MNSTNPHVHRIEESLVEKLLQQAEQARDPHIQRQLLIAATELLDHALSHTRAVNQ